MAESAGLIMAHHFVMCPVCESGFKVPEDTAVVPEHRARSSSSFELVRCPESPKSKYGAIELASWDEWKPLVARRPTSTAYDLRYVPRDGYGYYDTGRIMLVWVRRDY